MAVAVSESILKMLKDSLHITYATDESTESRLANEAADGIRYIKNYCDSSATCEPGSRFAALLCEYVLRAEAGALESFQKDYAQEIRAAKAETDVRAYAEAMGYAED